MRSRLIFCCVDSDTRRNGANVAPPPRYYCLCAFEVDGQEVIVGGTQSHLRCWRLTGALHIATTTQHITSTTTQHMLSRQHSIHPTPQGTGCTRSRSNSNSATTTGPQWCYACVAVCYAHVVCVPKSLLTLGVETRGCGASPLTQVLQPLSQLHLHLDSDLCLHSRL